MPGSRPKPVKPLRVVNDAQQRPLLCDVRYPVQDRQANEKRIRWPADIQPERHPQRLALRDWQPIESSLHHLRAQVMQSRERELCLGLHATRADHTHASGSLAQVV
jgi:hypothetical protein